jgi:uncharacterized protein
VFPVRFPFRVVAIFMSSLFAFHGHSYVPNGVEDGKSFLPIATGWSSPELRALTNSPPDSIAQQIKKFREAGGKGDAASLLSLAVLHERGVGLGRDSVEAARLCRQAADLGFAPAQHQYGLYLSAGIGVDKDLKESVHWFEKAATQQYAPAEYVIGYCHLHGEGVETNQTMANAWWRKAADRDFPPALHNLAVSCLRGRAMATNVAEGLRLLRRASDLGSLTSTATIAAVLADEDQPESINEAVRLARGTAEKGDLLGQRLYSQMLLYGRGVPRDPEASVRWLQRAAGRGDWNADAQLGLLYLEGKGVTTNFVTALYWLQPAAEAGNAAAQRYLGRMYSEGQGVPVDFARAMDLFGKSSAQGFAAGWFEMGWMHAKGLGVPKDETQAFAYYLRSAELGWPRGQLMTATSFLLGRGVQTNVAEGIHWLIKSCASGEPEAVKLLNGYTSQIRDPRLIEAAVEALKRAARLGSAEAAFHLGRRYRSGNLVLRDRAKACSYLTFAATNGMAAAATENAFALLDLALGKPAFEEAIKWIEYAAEHEDMQGIFLLASHYLSTRKIELGTNWLWRGVQKGQALSMTQLGLLLNDGRIIPRDGNAAWALLKRSAELGHAPAQEIVAAQAFMTPALISVSRALRYLTLSTEQQWPPAIFRLSQVYLAGEHVPRDLVRAREYLARAAELNDPSAQFNLGLTFLQGQFGETNYSKAAGLLRSSAEQGNASAQSAYANMVARAQGTELDLVEAWKWFELAATQGEKNAPAAMKILATHLTPAQIEEARQRAKTFVPTNRQMPIYLSLPRPPSTLNQE